MPLRWKSFFAHHYDSFMEPVERRCLGAVRSTLLAQSSGRVLEVGAGTGANLPHYPEGAYPLVSEPDRDMRLELRSKFAGEVARAPFPRVLAAEAERLPFGAAAFDCVVVTLVLCSVRDPLEVSREIRRVLVPGGRLLFVEHVRAAGRHGAWQDRLQPLWSAVGCGCHPNRDTPAILQKAGFEFDELEAFDPFEGVPKPLYFMSRIVLPFVWGLARRDSRAADLHW